MDNFISPSFTVSFAFPSKYPPKEDVSSLPCFVALSVTVYTPSSVGFNAFLSITASPDPKSSCETKVTVFAVLSTFTMIFLSL